MSYENDWFDHIYDKINQFFETLLDNDFARQWFLWIEWVTLTAALWAVGEKSGSIVVKGIALFSALLVFFRAWVSVERFAVKTLPKSSDLSGIIIWGGTFLVALIPFALIHFLAEVFRSVLG